MSGSLNIPGSTPGRRRGAAVAVGVVIVAVVAGVLATGGPGSPTVSSSTSPGASQAVASSTAPNGVPSAAPSEPPEQDWSAVDLPPYAAVADLRADRADAAGVRLDTAFTLASLTGADPRTMATRLETDPELTLAVAAGPTPTSVSLRPGRAAGRRADLPVHAPGRGRQRRRLVGLPVPRAAPCRDHAARGCHDRRPDRHRDRGHLRPGRSRRHGGLLLDLAGRERTVRAARPDPGVRPDRAASGHPVHGHDPSRPSDPGHGPDPRA